MRFIVFLKSCVSCQALAQAVEQNSALTILDLIGNFIGSEGAKAWCLGGSEERQRKDQDTPYEKDVIPVKWML